MTLATEFPAVTETVTQEMINDYAELSGDFNPLHVDLEVAAQSEFGGTIAHGPVALQVIFRSLSEGLGADALPAGTRVSVTFRAPVRPGDQISARVGLVTEEEDGMRLELFCQNHDRTVVSANVHLPR